MKHIKLGELLVRTGYLSEANLKRALAEQEQWGGRIGRVLVEMKLVEQEVVLKALTKQLGLERADLSKTDVPAEIVAKIDPSYAAAHQVCPERYLPDRRTLLMAMVDHLDVEAIDEVKTRTGLNVVTTLASGAEITDGLKALFGSTTAKDGNVDPAANVRSGDDYFETKDFRETNIEATTSDGLRENAMQYYDTKDFRTDPNLMKELAKEAKELDPDDPLQKQSTMEMFETKDFGSAAADIQVELEKDKKKK